MPFLKDGSDSGSDFGLVGCLALFVGSCVVLRPSFKSPAWVLSAAGFALLVLTSFTVAWMPWNARFLCLSFILFGVSLATLVFEPPNDRFRLQLILGLIIIWSAISLPLHCGQRRPFDFWNALFARTDLSFKQKPEIKQVYEDVLNLQISNPGTWFLVAGENSWTLPFLARPGMNWQLTPRWDQLLKARKALTEPNDAFALVLNTPLPQEIPFEIVKAYPSSTFIVRIPADTTQPTLTGQDFSWKALPGQSWCLEIKGCLSVGKQLSAKERSTARIEFHEKSNYQVRRIRRLHCPRDVVGARMGRAHEHPYS